MADDPPDPSVAISNRQDLPVDAAALGDLVRRTLEAEGVRAGELSLSFVTSEEMAALHERYMGEPGPTDVLAFPQEGDGLLGDVIVCPEVARDQNPDAAAELSLLTVHGTLHLLGYDHDSEDDRSRMWERQARYSGVRVPLDEAAHAEREASA